MAISAHDEAVQLIIKAFGLPSDLTSFTIHCEVGSILTIDCTYYPNANALEPHCFETLSKRFTLVEVEDKSDDE